MEPTNKDNEDIIKTPAETAEEACKEAKKTLKKLSNIANEDTKKFLEKANPELKTLGKITTDGINNLFKKLKK